MLDRHVGVSESRIMASCFHHVVENTPISTATRDEDVNPIIAVASIGVLIFPIEDSIGGMFRRVLFRMAVEWTALELDAIDFSGQRWSW
jgi:hypothetical protein